MKNQCSVALHDKGGAMMKRSLIMTDFPKAHVTENE